MANDVSRRCGCRDESGKQYGANCPKLASDPRHGTWGYRVAGGTDPATGRRVEHRKAGFATKKAAQEARNKVLVKVDQGTYVAPTKEKVGDYLEKWLPVHATTGKGLKPTTYSNYERYLRNDIVPSSLGRMPLSDVRRYHLNEFLAGLVEEGRGAVTVHRIATVLQAAFRSAYRSDRIDHNPSTDLQLPTVKKKRLVVWEPEQVGRFLDEASKHRLGPMFEVAMFTGLRRGELIGLRWADVDLINRVLYVRNNRVQAGRKVLDYDTKNEASTAPVELDDEAVAAFISWQIKQAEEREAGQEAYTDTGYVFTMEDGRPLLPPYATRLFEKIRLTVGDLPKITFHGQRHEHGALVLAGGADIAVVSKRLRHATINQTSDTYGHLLQSVSRNAAEKASAMVPRTKSALTMRSQGLISVTEDEKIRITTEQLPSNDTDSDESPLPDSNRRPPVYKTE